MRVGGWGLTGRSRAWASDDRRAVAVAGPALATRDRMAVWGAGDAAVPLVRQLLAEIGPGYRPLGDRELITTLAGEIQALTYSGTFGWMDRPTHHPGHPGPRGGRARWLPAAMAPEVGRFLAAAHPASYAHPGVPGVQRWAGIRDDRGALAAVGALAWSAPAVGFLAGIAVHPRARRQGLGRQVCGFLLAEALRVHEMAALMVDEDNAAAIRLYRSLGLRYQSVGTATFTPDPSPP